MIAGMTTSLRPRGGSGAIIPLMASIAGRADHVLVKAHCRKAVASDIPLSDTLVEERRRLARLDGLR
jgi:hypothetical protein